MEADSRTQLQKLISLFQYNIDQYKGKHYDEAKARADFIDKFFELLGWHIYNKQGYSEKYRDVVREDKVLIKGKVKAPDYCFRIGGKRMFFVEAKKPSIDIKHEVAPAFQLRRYAYTSKLNLSILTDFEEFAVYDTRIKPDKKDNASTARILYCTYDEYVKEFEFIFNTFSRDAILKGSFDKYIEDTKRKKGTSEVDKEFLKLIETWRENLARNIALRNKDLSIYELNFAVQAVIDRIIFLRIAEDRGMEKYGRIQNIPDSKQEIYPQLVSLFYQADEKYNSGLFDFKKDQLTPKLKVDDKILTDIIKHLYYPDSPYEFSVFDVEILGNIYEQFLGKTIRLTPAHQAKVEDKPEVKKAGGVYYTPKYIVDYIVQHTVGEKIKGKTPEEISTLRIMDPACGSGSFLLGAYQLLLDYHLNYYTGWDGDNKRISSKKQESILNRALKENKIYQLQENEYRLTIEEKQHILLNNIYGVDIDRQAVEVTKLSLLLKLLEGESMESSGQLFKFSDLKLLPDLSDNIKCGNSLIGSDFYEKGQMSLFQDEETMRRINVFDWEKEFPEIFKKGGFDVVIGNPPYGAKLIESEIEYLCKLYKIQNYKLDTYFLFIEKSLLLLNKEGLLGMIIPNTWLLNLTSERIRKYIFDNIKIENIVHYCRPVFDKATVDIEIIIFRNINPNNEDINITIFNKDNSLLMHTVPQEKWQSMNGKPVNIFLKPEILSIVDKINSNTILNDICKITQGSKPFQVGKGIPKQTRKIVDEKPFVSNSKLDKSFRPLLRGSMIRKYLIMWDNDYWISFGDWLAEPRYSANYDAPQKIIIRQTGDSLIATLDINQYIVRDNLYTIVNNLDFPNLKYILGILNSKLLNWFYQNAINYERGEALAQVKRGHLAILPIYIPNDSENEEKERYNKMVEMVDQMLEVQKKYHTATIETEKNLFKKQIDILDKQIDQLVYQLYGLTPEEIAIVEKAS
ncbi:MAG: N-6 DNA methylase [Candidatus Aminicenantes bacterium]|nr:N-6 DNA methylase [Candidatus Aminicenantes bacterium]